MTKRWFAERLRSLARKMTSLAFVTWAGLLAVYLAKGQPIDVAFLAFTAAVIGIKTYRDINGGGTPPATPATTGEA